jgi:hypothetical protein
VPSNRYKHLHRGHYYAWTAPALEWTSARNTLVLGSHCTGLDVHGGWNQPALAVPSAEQPPAWEQITPQFI